VDRLTVLSSSRGGGPNFGIVASFTFATLPVDKIWFAARLYSHEENQQLLEALLAYQDLADGDGHAHIVLQLSEDPSVAGSFVGFFYMKPTEWPAVFKAFYDIPEAATMINSSFGMLADMTEKYNNPQYPDAGIPPLRYAAMN
jgi:hypothetical protein